MYNHLDVQPASKETEPWRTEPFVFTKDGETVPTESVVNDLNTAWPRQRVGG